MIITLHFVVENLSFLGLRVGDEVVLDDVKDIRADILQLSLDLLLVLLDERGLLGVTLLLDGGNNSPARTSRANDVLVGNRQQISLLNAQLLGLTGNRLHVVNHFIEAAENEQIHD